MKGLPGGGGGQEFSGNRDAHYDTLHYNLEHHNFQFSNMKLQFVHKI